MVYIVDILINLNNNRFLFKNNMKYVQAKFI